MPPRRRRQTPLVAATETAITAAGLGDLDAGAVEALRALARKIDAWDQIVEYALDDIESDGNARGRRPAVPQNDNVSISAYLKCCESLGLTPAGRERLTEKKPEAAGGTLGKLRLAHGS